MTGNSELGIKSPKRGPNILCRRVNISPQKIIEFVQILPKTIIPVEKYREIMGEVKDWFGKTHQAPEQWGLFYFDDKYYYPRFSEVPSLEEAEEYVYRWIRKFPITNPYAKFEADNPNGLVLSIVRYIEKHPEENNLKHIIQELLGNNEPFVCNDMIANAINNYSQVLKVQTIDKENEVFHVSLTPTYKKIIDIDYMDKKTYFELFNVGMNVDISVDIANSSFRPYLTAIKSKPFLLLAGISGTGKSRIVRELARACWDEGSEEYKEHKPRNFEMVQVKPNWHDSSELMGYVSRIGADKDGNGVTFVAGDFLKFIARAWEEQDVPYFLCLDEMNLAPVEQYFAEYLSVVESRKATGEGVVTDPILRKSIEPWYFNLCAELTSDDDLRQQFLSKGICIPQNLIVIGTVNMDETTFSFSRKVLDRAMTIEMNEVDLEGGLTERYEAIGKLGTDELIGTCVEGVDVYSAHKGVCDKVIAYLKVINDKLEGTPFKIAYRTRNEFLLYVVNNLPYNKDEEGKDINQDFIIARALDEITNMKILSRIEGDETKVSKLFNNDELSNTIKTALADVCAEYDTEASISLAKLKEMKDKLENGYTSFWS